MSDPLFYIGDVPVKFAFPDGDAGSCIDENAGSGTAPVATVQLQCPWADRYIVFSGLLGTATGGPGAIYRVAPFAYPPSPNLFCVGISSARPTGRHTGGWDWDECRFSATFSYPPFNFVGQSGGITDPSGQPWTTTRARVSANVTQVPLGTFKWLSGTDAGKAVPEAQLGITVPHTEYVLTRHLMPYLPIDEAETYVGKVNDTEISIGNRTYNAGELLFAGMGGECNADVQANRTFRAEYTILGVKGHTWNQLLDRKLVWIEVNTEADGSGDAPFGEADFWNGLP